MLAESSHQVYSGGLDREIHLPSTARSQLMEFIARELPRWRDHPARPDKQAETTLTEHLCDHLNSSTYYSDDWSHIQFRAETGDETKGGRKIDLAPKPRAAVLIIEGRRHTQFDALFPIECKRLPTPREKDRDEREYVITEPGTTGGIQRFKFGHHGASHKFAAMIAYVQENDSTHWLAMVNGWINSLSMQPDSLWNQGDELHLSCHDPLARIAALKSLHQRSDDLGDCELQHLWIEMN